LGAIWKTKLSFLNLNDVQPPFVCHYRRNNPFFDQKIPRNDERAFFGP